MAKLIVEASAEDSLAAPGNTGICWMILSVTNADGVPVTTLTAPNLQIHAPIVGPGGANVSIGSVETLGSGFYRIKLFPISGQTWKAGGYIFTVAVTSGADKGQTLASMMLD